MLVHVFRLQVLTLLVLASVAQAGNLTVINQDSIGHNPRIKKNGVVVWTPGVVAAEATGNFTDSIIDTGTITGEVTYNGRTYQMSGSFSGGSGTLTIVNMRFYASIQNNLSVADSPKIFINGVLNHSWGSLPAGTSGTGNYTWWDFGNATFTVKQSNNTLGIPNAGYSIGDYVGGLTMSFYLGSSSYNITRCIRNQYLSPVTGKWYRDGVLVYREEIPAGQSVCKTFAESSGSHTFEEYIDWWLNTMIDGELSGELVEQAVGSSVLSGANTNTYDIASPPLPAGSTSSPIAQTNFLTGGYGNVVGFTNTALGGTASEGTLQAGLNSLVVSGSAGTEKIVAAVNQARDGIVSAIWANGSNGINVNITNGFAFTNMGDTNLSARWDVWTNRGAVTEGNLGALPNLPGTVTSHESIGTGQSSFGDLVAVVPGSGASPVAGTAPWSLDVAGFTVDLNPANHELFGPLLTQVKSWVRFLVYFVFCFAVFRRLDAIVGEGMLTQQGRAPNVQVLGNSVGMAAAPAYLAAIATALVALVAGVVTIAQAQGVAFAVLGTDPFAGASGPIALGVGLAYFSLPLDTIITLALAYLVIFWQSRSLLWGTQIVIRLMLA